jgi:hypothetical protein
MPQTLDVQVARGIKQEVTRGRHKGQPVIQRTVNWLLDQFDLAHLDEGSAAEIEQLLSQVGVRVEPALASLGQSGSVNLTAGSVTTHCAIRHWELPVNGPVVETDYASAKVSDGQVHWFDVDLSCSPEDLYSALAPLCPDLDREMIQDLTEPDVQPKAIPYGEHVRSVSLVGVEARTHSRGTAERWGGELAFQLVETLSGPGWIITCWHNSRICSGTVSDRDEAPSSREALIAQLLEDWRSQGWKSPGDIGTGLAFQLIQTMPVAFRELEAWLQRWEMNHYRERCEAHGGSPATAPDTATLNSLLSLVSEFRRRAAAEESSRGVTEESPWFDEVSDRKLDERADHVIDGILAKLDRLFDNVRADMELVTMNSIAEQARASASQASEVAETTRLIRERGEADERFQSQLGKVTALLLVPTLIAGMFGANTALPGGGSWMGFELMLVLMVASSLLVYLYIRPRHMSHEARVPESTRRVSVERIREIVLATS